MKPRLSLFHASKKSSQIIERISKNASGLCGTNWRHRQASLTRSNVLFKHFLRQKSASLLAKAAKGDIASGLFNPPKLRKLLPEFEMTSGDSHGFHIARTLKAWVTEAMIQSYTCTERTDTAEMFSLWSALSGIKTLSLRHGSPKPLFKQALSKVFDLFEQYSEGSPEVWKWAGGTQTYRGRKRLPRALNRKQFSKGPPGAAITVQNFFQLNREHRLGVVLYREVQESQSS